VHELGNTFTPMGEYINTRLPNGYEPVIEEGRAAFFLPGIIRTFIGDAPQTAVTKWYSSDKYPDGSITTSALDQCSGMQMECKRRKTYASIVTWKTECITQGLTVSVFVGLRRGKRRGEGYVHRRDD